MIDVLRELMADTGVVKKDAEAKYFGIKRPSRGYYIVIPHNAQWYLHHDGLVKSGVKHESDKPAFWNTKLEAENFFSEWKKTNPTPAQIEE